MTHDPLDAAQYKEVLDKFRTLLGKNLVGRERVNAAINENARDMKKLEALNTNHSKRSELFILARVNEQLELLKNAIYP